MISISHAPNATAGQRWQALGLLLTPWRWLHGSSAARLETALSSFHDNQPAVTFATGRQALSAVIHALGITEGHEVIIQAYTCIVVPQAVLANGAHPIYADIDASLNIDPQSVEHLITPRTKAVIVQHTFGVPADMDRLTALCREKGILLIEDCAHAIGAMYKGQRVGTFGDAAIFSFGRDKIISSVSGGMAIVKFDTTAQALRSIQKTTAAQSRRTIAQNLLHPLLVPIFSALMGGLRVGNPLMRISQRLGLLNKVYTAKEIKSAQGEGEGKAQALPNAMAALALRQFKIDYPRFIKQRREHIAGYDAWIKAKNIPCRRQAITPESVPAWLRYTMLCDQAETIFKKAKKQHILLGDWYAYPIIPKPADDTILHYQPGSCPRAEEAARKSINLPTQFRFSAKQRDKMLKKLEKILL
ncbi:MAG: aminotransferase class I/II-fold pyridoxal phosphate-dependent enzyme [Parcubacteria group bacterium]|nr:aminotransferase class I/II-fold pyridoxal phosphate-dependent enzyme [Parcubacteria group bacterium]